jgi:uncharacterized protein (TIGR02246 family)
VNVRFLTGDTAIVVSEDGGIFPGQDAVASERLVRATWVLVRRDGGWRIASYHNSPASWTRTRPRSGRGPRPSIWPASTA